MPQIDLEWTHGERKEAQGAHGLGARLDGRSGPRGQISLFALLHDEEQWA